MADRRHRRSFIARVRMLGRIVGLTALLAAGIGAFILSTVPQTWNEETLQRAYAGAFGPSAWWGTHILGFSVVAIAGVLLLELLGNLFGSAGRRSVAGVNAFVQTVLVVGIVVAVNAYSFTHFKRYDLTTDQRFTLPAPVIEQLKKLRGDTTIVVLQQHKSAGGTAKSDRYDFAAERKVVEKVRDLAELFRRYGPNFRVVTLDVEEDGFDKAIEDLTRLRPGLKDAITAAPENSIFFYADDRVAKRTSAELLAFPTTAPTSDDPAQAGQKLVYEANVQRLSFNDFYRLDKAASAAADPDADGKPRGNLVLHPQGVEAFLQRLLAAQEKKPRIGLAVIHEVLTSSTSADAPDSYSHNGLRKSLQEYGFEVTDIILKKWPGDKPPSAAVYNSTETALEKLEARKESLRDEIKQRQDERETLVENRALFRDPIPKLKELFRARFKREATAEDLAKQLAGIKQSYRLQTGRELTDEERAKMDRNFTNGITQIDDEIARSKIALAERETETEAAFRNERSVEDRRVEDIEAKFTKILDDCDLLIVPRQTIINIHAQMWITPNLFALRDDPADAKPGLSRQVKVIREFMKKGKPVMACIGPNGSPRAPATSEPIDDFETLLLQRGVELGRRTVLYNAEEVDFAEASGEESFGRGGRAEIPEVEFPLPTTGPVNPLTKAMRIARQSADRPLDIRLRHPRPISLQAAWERTQPFPAEFLFTTVESWNEEKPFPVIRDLPTGERVVISRPRRPSAATTEIRDRLDDRHAGAFPIGIAAETPIPAEWFDERLLTGKAAAGWAGALGNADHGLLAAGYGAFARLKQEKSGLLMPVAPSKSRIVVLGSGQVFAHQQLTPGTETLLLNCCNWLLGREERLPTDAGKEWKFPRVELSEQAAYSWRWATFLGLPVLFAYLGLIVLLFRKVR